MTEVNFNGASKENGSSDNVQEAISNLKINPYQQAYLLPEWKDITDFLDEATNDFDVGQLVHLESFGLYDSMAAIEIMDPKMDTGMRVEGQDASKDFDASSPLSASQILGVMDKLCSCELAWHSGHSLSQTIFTCLYVHNVFKIPQVKGVAESDNNLVSLVLKAYVLGVIKCCQLVWQEMIKGNVYEEEDFTTNKYGLSFYEDFPESETLNLLEDAEEWLMKIIKTANEDEEIRFKDGYITDGSHAKALLSRIQLRKRYLLGLVYISGMQFSESQKEFDLAKSLLDGLGPGTVKSTLSLAEDVMDAFDPLINRKLAAQAPPRPITLVTVNEAYANLSALCGRLSTISTITQCHSVETLINFFFYYSQVQPQACAVSRSYIQSALYSDHRILGRLPVFYFVRDSIIESVRPPLEVVELPSGDSSHKELYSLVTGFITRAAKPFIDTFKVYCQNRSRQRRVMCKLLREWEILQEEAEHIDEQFHAVFKSNAASLPFFYSSWVYHRKLSMMIQVAQLGFDLELFAEYEYLMMFWHLDYLYGAYSQHLERIVNITLTCAQGREKATPSQGNRDVPESASPLAIQRIQVTGLREMTRGIYLMIAAFNRTGHIRSPSLKFDDERTRFCHRFRMYNQLVSPTPLSYNDYQETLRQIESISIHDLLITALRSFQTAKSVMEGLLKFSETEVFSELSYAEFTANAKAVIRVCIGNSLTLQTAIKDPEVASLSKKTPNQISQHIPTKSISYDFKYHRSFPVITIR
ncbi:Mak10-domain-containing protein [Basidiobolus meristosporus CBS 931.73]|uniref:Mak10-domain-containing protein n=1 Tax=Basidiobolus meristosporus CBS 931.73 TaxID=1314790 RepID=A0A1Y1YUJ2_9FUNG|nr:Mak10-domain-containing protein [Basidiobolus meristosporus CBS 931.73]|eukprot:ORY01708.1 Mak10-domain-containing protein [Basidiobolus meristosporus CBS 931.73]